MDSCYKQKTFIGNLHTHVCALIILSAVSAQTKPTEARFRQKIFLKQSGEAKSLRSSPRKPSEPQPPDQTSINVINIHSYAQVQPSTTTDDGLVTASTSSSGMTPQATQTCPPSLTDVGTETLMPELVIESISHSIELIMFYTGLPDSKTFHALFGTLIEHGADKLSTESIDGLNTLNLGCKRNMRHIDEFLLVMMGLRLGLLVKDLEYRFKTSASSVSKIFYAWILFMSVCLCSIVLLAQLKDL